MSSARFGRTTIGPYRVIDFVGAGGMGAVYRVAHRDTGEIAAIKVLDANAVGGTGLERFRNEARIHQALVHPHIARMFGYLEVDDLPCLVMEYIPGESLDEYLRRTGPLSLPDALRIFAALAEGVEYVHRSGVVHRDLKTNNVRISEDGTVKLLDFGIATASGVPRLTSTGNVVGTLQSLAPEQLATGRAEPRSDIWALGIVFYEILTGMPPFTANAPGLLGEHILQGTYTAPSARRMDITLDVDRVVARCLRVRPDDRYPSVTALLEDIRRLHDGAEAAPERLRPGWRSISGPSAKLHAQINRRISQSGEMVRRASREWRLLLAALSALAALAFVIVTLQGPSEGSDPDRGASSTVTADDRPSRDAKPVASGALGASDGTTLGPAVSTGVGSPVSSMRRVTIRVLEGRADVYRNEVLVGTTPYQLEAPLGAEISLVLRRAGCADTPIRLRMIEGLEAVMESMRSCQTP